MKKNNIEDMKNFLGLLFILVIFLVLSYFVQNNIDFFQAYIGDGFFGVIIYMFILIAEVVFAPISALPLIAIVSNLWDLWFVVLITLIAWTIGSVIAFVIAKKYGKELLRRFISIKEINKIEKRIPREHLFAGVVFLRIILPTDLISYALGLFTRMKVWRYTLATFIGYAPIALIFAYFGNLSFELQLWISMFFILFFVLFLFLRRLCENRRCNLKKRVDE